MPIGVFIDGDSEWDLAKEKILKLEVHEQLRDVQDILVMMGSKTRMKILELISNGGSWTLKDLSAKMATKDSNISQQIDKLEAVGLVKRFRQKGESTKLIVPIYERIQIDFRKKE